MIARALAPHPTLLAAALLAAVALAAYANSFRVPFLLDDQGSILDNASLRAWRTAVSPPSHAGVGGRPLLNATFALNFAIGGLDVRGYHAANLAIHFLVALALFGLVRRTLLRARFGADAFPLALLVAALWAAHPVQTNSVTYLSQRAESLMALFYLLTLYCFARAAESSAELQPALRPNSNFSPRPPVPSRLSPASWQILSIAACLLGVLTKEIIATAPLAVLLYDRVFVAGTFRAALAQRPRFYLALALAWVPLAFLLVDVGERSVGPAPGVTVADYALTQCRALVTYLRVAAWPHPLNFYHDVGLAESLRAVAPQAAALLAVALALFLAWRRRPALAFGGLAFFLILAPTSSFIPIRFMPIAESRVYLPLAAAVATLVLALHAALGRRVLFAGAAVVVLLAGLTHLRNRTYRSASALWTETAALSPHNPNVLSHLAHTCWIEGRIDDAIRHWTRALELGPNFPRAACSLATALARAGRPREALPRYLEAIRLRPDFPDAHHGLGNLLLQLGQLAPAIGHLHIAARLSPADSEVPLNLGVALARAGRDADARASYERVLALNPRHAPAHNNLANLLAEAGRLAEALPHYEAALQVRPDYFEALCNYGNRLAEAGRTVEGIAQIERALALQPAHAGARFLLGQALARAGRRSDAIVAFEAALRLDPRLDLARAELARLRAARE